jgi:sRNA-binding protein
MQSAGSARINLQGEDVEKVTPEHAEIARKSLEEWQNKKAARENNKQYLRTSCKRLARKTICFITRTIHDKVIGTLIERIAF